MERFDVGPGSFVVVIDRIKIEPHIERLKSLFDDFDRYVKIAGTFVVKIDEVALASFCKRIAIDIPVIYVDSGRIGGDPVDHAFGRHFLAAKGFFLLRRTEMNFNIFDLVGVKTYGWAVTALNDQLPVFVDRFHRMRKIVTLAAF